MEKNSLLTFFEVVSRKIKCWISPKNTISRLGLQLPNLSYFAKISFIVFIFLISSKSFAQLMRSSSVDLSRSVAFNKNGNQQNDPWAYGQKTKNLANLNPYNSIIPQWETLQSVKLSQPNSSGDTRITLAPIKINLDQIRNGSGASPTTPAEWVNGNAGASNAHYVEGWAIPYRAVFTDLPLGSNRSIDIEWDIKHTGANAIDFITNYDLIDFAVGTHATNFGHVQEVINPMFGFAGLTSNQKDIPIPNLPAFSPNPGASGTFIAIQSATGNKDAMTIFGGTISKLEYVSQGNLANPSASTRLRITFDNTSTTVILSWAGHIAKATDWGLGNSAAAVAGSPYHTRLISYDLNGDGVDQISIGNQDRSLSAAAVVDPPACIVNGVTGPVCPGSTNEHINSDAVDPNVIPSGFTYTWTIIGNGDIVDAQGNVLTSASTAKVLVRAKTTCNLSYTVTLTIKKNGALVDACSKTVSVNDTQAPTITCPSAPTSPISCSATPVFGNATATDNCDTSVTVTFADVDVAGSCVGTYTRTRTWTATDDCNNAATCSQSVTVRDITPPTITCPSAPTSPISCPSTPVFGNATATDNCDTSVTVTFADVDVAGSCLGTYTRTRTWTATDDCGNAATCSQSVTVRDITPPTITCPSAPTSPISCPSTPVFGNATATDNCDTSVTVTFADVDVAGSCVGTYTRTRTWTAIDDCGNAATCSQSVTVRDITPPTITCPSAPTSPISCPATPVFGNATATDNCDTSVTVTFADVDVAGSCLGTYTRTRTWTATDDCGNAATCSQSVTVRDITPPTITCPPDAIVECGAPIEPTDTGTATATDNCGSATVNHTDATTSVGCQKVITRTWTATDGCGNTATCVQRILVIDRTVPVFTSCPVEGAAEATDNCSSPANIVIYKSNGVWTAIDESGNISTCEEGSLNIAPLKQLEQTATDSKKTAITSKTATAGFDAYPVPFKDQLTIKYKFDYKSDVKIEVFNEQGISVLSKTDTNSYLDKELTLDLKASKRQEQVYVVKVTTNQGTFTKKVMSSK